jgi:hypothetical protein
MERNADDMFGATGNPGSAQGGSSSVGSGGTGMAGSTAPSGGLDHSTSTSSTGGQTNKTEQAKAAVQDKVGQVKDATLATATEGSSVSAPADARMANVQDSVARGMNKSADWLRNGDLRADIERQVRENPGRTLLIALGLGYVLGKAFRNNDR